MCDARVLVVLETYKNKCICCITSVSLVVQTYGLPNLHKTKLSLENAKYSAKYWTLFGQSYTFINGEGSFQIDHVVARGFDISHISSPNLCVAHHSSLQNEEWGGFLKKI